MHQIEDDIAEWMLTFIMNLKQAHSMMIASYELYVQQFSSSVWKSQMQRVVTVSFPELEMLGI